MNTTPMVAIKQVGSLVRGEVFEVVHMGTLTGFTAAVEGVDCLFIHESSDVIPAAAAFDIDEMTTRNLQKDPHFILENPKAKLGGKQSIELIEISWGNPGSLRVELKELLADLGLTLKGFRELVKEYEMGSILLHKQGGKWTEAK